jgi:septal ring factor EnvC (AmiA/AmiB activator)
MPLLSYYTNNTINWHSFPLQVRQTGSQHETMLSTNKRGLDKLKRETKQQQKELEKLETTLKKARKESGGLVEKAGLEVMIEEIKDMERRLGEVEGEGD